MGIRCMLAAIVAVMIFPALSAADEVVVIGNASVSASALEKREVKNIFLGMKTRWDDGSPIVFVVRKDSKIHKNFLINYVDKSPYQFTNYWNKIIFTGKGFSPQYIDSDQEMIKFVSETKGAIGYVSSSTNLNRVTTISIK